MTRDLGPFIAGERPPPWEHQFLDDAGLPLDLTGFAFAVTIHTEGGVDDERPADPGVDPRPASEGWARFDLTADDVDTPGVYVLTMWAGNGTTRLASDPHVMRVNRAAGTAPAV